AKSPVAITALFSVSVSGMTFPLWADMILRWASEHALIGGPVPTPARRGSYAKPVALRVQGQRLGMGEKFPCNGMAPRLGDLWNYGVSVAVQFGG
ncbi:MAG: hypothetical protein V4657_09270, partial [Pseudomonadota bacterium]